MNKAKLEEICKLFTNIIKYDSIRPITDLVEIYCTDGVCHIGSTDGITRIVATMEDDNELENSVVSLSMLTKLLKLTTVDDISITNHNSYVELIGNGKYKLPVQLDEAGDKISLTLGMPQHDSNTEEYDINIIKNAIERIDVSLYKGTANKILNYYVNEGNKFIATDCSTMAIYYGESFFNQTYPNLLKQVSNLPNNFTYSKVANGHRFSCDNIEMFILLGTPTEFPLQSIMPFLDISSMFSGSFSFNKSDLAIILKRLEVFKSPIDAIPLVILSIKDNKVTITDKRDSCIEVLEGTMNNIDNTVIAVNIEFMIKCLRKMNSEITLMVNKSSICLQDNEGYYVIAGVDDNE